MPYVRFNFTFKLARILRRWQLGVACLDTSRLATLAEDKPRLNLTEPTEITENGSVTKAVFAANPLGESPLFFVYGIFRFCPYFEVRIFALSFRIWLLYSRHNCYYEKIGDSEPILLEDLPFEIPDAWSWSKVSGLFLLQTGASFKKETAMADKSQTRVLRGGNIQKGTYLFLDNDIFIKNELVSSNINLRKNDLITPAVTSLENIGKIARITKDYDYVTVGGFVFILRAYHNNDTLSKYLYYAIQSEYFTEKLKYITKASGSAFFNINKERFLQLLLPIPPESQQMQIVSFLEEVFTFINLIEKNQDDYSVLTESLKKAILKSAIQGTLVEQNENDEPSSILLERIRAEKKAQLGKKYVESYIYKGVDNRYYEKVGTKEPILLENLPFEIPSSWSWARISHIAQLSSGKPYQEVEDGYLYVKVSDMNLVDNSTYITKSTHFCATNEKDLLKSPCIIFPKRGGAIATNKKRIVKDIKICIDLNTMALIPDDARFIDYLYWWFSLVDLYSFSDGSSIPQINNSDIYPLLIPIPPNNEQIRICNHIKQIFASIKDEG